MKKKIIALCLVICLAATAITGGTLAWLTDMTAEVKNTFNPTDIDVELEETTEEYDMVPGWDIAKDPKAWVTADSEDCYLFVSVDESTNFDAFMTYAIADGWTLLNSNPPKEGSEIDTVEEDNYVIYRIVNDANQKGKDCAFPILEGNKVTVSGEVDKEDMDGVKGNEPTLTFTAYAHQLYKMDENERVEFSVAEAWRNLTTSNTTDTN